jgi:hypothetical protein
MNQRRSRLGLDEEQPIGAKLVQTFFMLTFGPIVGLVIFAAIRANVFEPIALFVAHSAFTTLVVFWGLSLVFLWWRPAWLRHIYLPLEARVVFVTQAVFIVVVVVFLGNMIADFVEDMWR